MRIQNASILFVHPQTHMYMRCILPLSLPALINRIHPRFPVLGRFHNEWTPDEVRQARLIVMDLHWYVGLRSTLQLAAVFKRINPSAVIAVGGIAASLFAKQILRDSPIDYVIRGDGEIPLQQLAEAVMWGRSVETVPNLLGRSMESPEWYCLTQEDIDTGDYRDIAWFPTWNSVIRRLHRYYSNGRTHPTYPYVVLYRGCVRECDGCCGAARKQQWLFRRNQVVRDPLKVREDLMAWSEDPDIRFVNFHHDLAELPADYRACVLERAYNLDVMHEFYATPSEDALESLLHSFRGGTLVFPLDIMHATSPCLGDLDVLIARIRQAQQAQHFRVRLAWVSRFAQSQPHYAQALDKVRKATGCFLNRADYWWDRNPQPLPNGCGTEEDYEWALAHQRHFCNLNRLYKVSVVAHRFFPSLTLALSQLYDR